VSVQCPQCKSENNDIPKAYDNLCGYTLKRKDPSFIHQHVVDAFAAQDSDESDKPIRLTFALVGLSLHVEKNFTGRQVQLVQMRLGRKKQQKLAFRIPVDRGKINAATVLAASIGERDKMIHEWCASVRQAFSGNCDVIEELLRENGVTDSFKL
jgi:hypothetical protein